MKILANILVQNNEKWMIMFNQMFSKLEHDIDLYVYENNSTDGTKKYLFGKKIISENIDIPNWSRTERICHFRNKLKKNIESTDYDYVLLIDSNIFFSKKSLDILINTLENNSDVAMACPHAMVKTSLPCEFFYDTFATVLLDGTRCGQFTSVIECTSKNPKHDRHCHRVTGASPVFSQTPELKEVKSSFGGFVLLRYSAFKDSWWSTDAPSDCEHWKFCDDVRKHGKIVINTESKVIWTEF